MHIFSKDITIGGSCIKLVFYLNGFSVSSTFLIALFPLRHLQREIENQSAQANRFKQQMKKLEDDIRQNEGLLRRAHVEQKTAKVALLPLTD